MTEFPKIIHDDTGAAIGRVFLNPDGSFTAYSVTAASSSFTAAEDWQAANWLHAVHDNYRSRRAADIRRRIGAPS